MTRRGWPWLVVGLLLGAGCGADDGGGDVDAGARADGGGGEEDAGSGSTDGGGMDAGGGGADAGPTARVFEEVDGLVAVEAEHFDTNDDNGTPRAWYVTTTTDTPGITPDPDPNHADSASGGAYLEGLPDTRVTHEDPIRDGESIYNTPGDGPTLTYRIHFETTGRYYVWARAYSTGGEDNGIHVGIDDTWPDSGRPIQWCSGKNQWTWSNAQRDSGGSACGVPGTIWIDVDTPGEHLVRFSMREDGMELDKLVLAMDEAFEPEGEGPAERPRR